MALLRICSLTLTLALFAAAAQMQPATAPADGRYLATAYNITGVTASGLYTHRHIVAADPDVLPLGTIIQVTNAGSYSGEYVVGDTGEKIQGRHIDIFIPTLKAALKFGVRHVEVRVLQLGKNTHRSAEAAYAKVKRAVAQDADAGTQDGAATAQDLAAAWPVPSQAPDTSE